MTDLDAEDLRLIAHERAGEVIKLRAEVERLRAIIQALGRSHVCGGAIKPGRESCTRCGAEEVAAAIRSVCEADDG